MFRDRETLLERDEHREPHREPPTTLAPLHERIGQPYCDGCESWECSCECDACGKQTQALIRGICIDCDDARRMDEGDSMRSLGMGGVW